jgi:hypothetical protein
MSEEKKEIYPIEYNYAAKHDPYFGAKLLTFKKGAKIHIYLEDFYDDAEKLMNDIVAYIRNERHLYCEAIDLNHFLINGKRYVLNVTRNAMFSISSGQSIILYKKEMVK